MSATLLPISLTATSGIQHLSGAMPVRSFDVLHKISMLYVKETVTANGTRIVVSLYLPMFMASEKLVLMGQKVKPFLPVTTTWTAVFTT